MSNASKTSNKSGVHCELSSLQMALAAGLCIAGASAFAQETATLSTVTVTDSAVNPIKAEQAVSSKFTAPLKETPKSVQIITEEVMKQTGATSLQEALKTSPGITFGSGEGGSSSGDRPFMRGSDAQSSMFIDGMRDIAPSAREVFNLESVEVVKGADSAYAGRGGAGGSINMSTKKPKNENFISGDIGLGTDSYKRATLDGNWKLGETTAFRLNAMAHDADVPGRNGPEKTRWGIAPSVTFGLNTPDRLTMSLQHLQSDDVPDGGIPFNNRLAADLPKSGVLIIKPNHGGNRKNWYGRLGLDRQEERSDVLTANYEHDFSDKNKLRNTLRYTNSSQNYIYAQPDDSKGSLKYDRVSRRYNTRASLTSTWQNVTELTGETTLSGLRHRFAMGAEFAHEASRYGSYSGNGFTSNASICSTSAINGQCASLSAPTATPYTGNLIKGAPTNKFQSNTIALYGFDTIDLTEQWLLNAGLRLDHYRTRAETSSDRSERNETLWNYQLGVVYKLTSNGNLYASIGSSSTPGNSNLGLDGDTSINEGTGNRGVLNAQALAPEKTRSIEFGTKWDLLNKKLALNAAIFRNEVTNARVTDAVTNGNMGRTSGQKVINGFEIGAIGRVAPGLDITAGYTFMDSTLKDNGRNADGSPKVGTGLAYISTPKHSGSIWATYKPNSKLTLGLGAYAQSSMVASYAMNQQALLIRQVSGYARYDAMVSYVINPNVTFQLNVMNLGDKEHYASANSPHYATLGAGRSAVASLKFNY